MTERKGLSQILYLIIAASVLMMVALSLIFMFNSSVTPGDSNLQACTTAIDTQCSATGASQVSVPPTCTTSAGAEKEVISGAESRIDNEPGEDDFHANCN
jgi:hypothetical protein